MFDRSVARSSALRLLLGCLLRSLSNEVRNLLRLLQHGDVACEELNRFSARLLCTGPFHRGSQSAVFGSDHMPGRLCLPSGMRQFFIQHRTVNLTLDSKDELAFRHGQSLGEVIENALRGHRREMLCVNLDGL